MVRTWKRTERKKCETKRTINLIDNFMHRFHCLNNVIEALNWLTVKQVYKVVDYPEFRSSMR